MKNRIALCFSVPFLAVSAAAAQEMGHVEEGEQLAMEVCSNCHAVTADEELSPNIMVPSFLEIANTPGMTAIALSAWAQSPHPTMPNFVFTEQEVADLAAYILSLKSD